MRPRLFVLAILLPYALCGPVFANRQVYTMVLCDTNADRVQKAVKDCGDTFLGMIESFRGQGISCPESAYIDGDVIGLDEVQRRISGLAIDQNDTLLCYYVGHGASIDRAHYLMTSRGQIPRQSLLNVLQTAPRVRPRLTVLVTECCANEIGRRGLSKMPQYAGLSMSEQVPDRSLLENLLLDHSGVVNVTSSSYQEITVAGIFSTCLREHLQSAANFNLYDSDQDGFVKWEEFFPWVARLTNSHYQQSKKTAIEDGEPIGEAIQNQQNQMPYAFSLGTPLKARTVEGYAPNFGLYFHIEPLDFACGARVTRTAAANTPAGRIQLEAGDLIVKIDDLPIWMGMDVLNHHSRTDVLFRNVRTGRLETRTTDLPAFTAYPPGVPTEYYARNFGMYYQLIAFGKTFGARMTRMPAANSPLLAIRLEPGDMLVQIDGQRVQTPQDVLSHRQNTEIIFINVRTGLPQRAFVNLP